MALQNSRRPRCPCPVDLFEDRLARGFPSVGSGAEVVVSQVDVDRRDQLADTGEAALANDVIGELPEETLDEIHPGGAGRGEVDVNARMLFEPGADDRMLVGRVVVDDQMQRQLGRSLAVDLLQEGEPFGMRVLRRGRAEDLSVEVIQGGEQRDRAMADVVVGPSADMADAQRQVRLGPFQRLALALLVAAEHQRLVRRVEIEADHVPELGLEVRVARQFERAGQMGLDLVCCPNPLHACRRDPHLPRHRANTPTGPIRRRLRRLDDQLFPFRFRDRRLRAAASRLLKTRQPKARKPTFPADDRRPAHSCLGRGRVLAAACRPQEHDARSADQPLRRSRSIDDAFQLPALLAGHLQRFDRSAHDRRIIGANTYCHANCETLH